ncbi:putative Late nodulin [Medicago truncatula]|uniref:Nodule Cysteine-Rich (NCR) secreted peptide n=1 Tax=Medicago truncatula TaxID=3880 RepID=A0A072UUY4_MEDTR|nr:Nodule Cysteine-Rich (NCR) secreted peptide [Medicago truncatula]RHN66800.1 putative Late nodulin [Medicago truncatula]
MAKTTKLIYVMILFLSLFLVAKNVTAQIRCNDAFECRRSAICNFPNKWKCNDHKCECV